MIIVHIYNNDLVVIYRFSSQLMTMMEQQWSDIIGDCPNTTPLTLKGFPCIVRLYLAKYYGLERSV